MTPEWRDMEESRQFFRLVRTRIQDLEKDLGRHERTIHYDSADNTALHTAITVGMIKGMVEVLEICEIRVG